MAYVFDPSKPIALGADHAGVTYKQEVKEWLEKKGYQVKILAPTLLTLWITQILHIQLHLVLLLEKQHLVFCFVVLQMALPLQPISMQPLELVYAGCLRLPS